MWLYNFYPLSLTIFTFLINCMFVENGPKDLYGNIYLAKNLEHSQIKKSFFDIVNLVLYAMDSTRKRNTGRDIDLKGMMVIIKTKENDKHETLHEDEIPNVNYISRTQIMRLQKQKDTTPSFKKDDRKIIVVIVDNTKKRETFARERQSKGKKMDSKNNKKTEDTNTKIRNTYGNTCIKVAVRKCYKALHAVYTIICKLRYKCRSSLKSKFTNKSKVSCINEFDNSKGRNKTNSQKKSMSVTFTGFEDVTREGYLDACIPYMVPNYLKKAPSTLRNDTSGNQFATILRLSESEKRCQRLSQAKCVKACHFALRESCARQACSERIIRVFSKVCRHECKRAYRIERSDSDSSSYSY